MNKPPNKGGIKVEWDEILALVVLFMVTVGVVMMIPYMGVTSDYEPIGVAVADEDWPQVEHSPLSKTSWNINSVAYSPDGSQIAYGSADARVYIHDAEDGSDIRELTQSSETVRTTVYSPDGSQIAYGGDDNNVYIHDAEDGSHIRTLTQASDLVRWTAVEDSSAPATRF